MKELMKKEMTAVGAGRPEDAAVAGLALGCGMGLLFGLITAVNRGMAQHVYDECFELGLQDARYRFYN